MFPGPHVHFSFRKKIQGIEVNKLFSPSGSIQHSRGSLQILGKGAEIEDVEKGSLA
jgi:hypothetical protein